MLLSPGENRLGSDRPNLWQLFKLGLIGTVQIERTLRDRAAARTTRPLLLSHLPGRMTCATDQYLLAIAQWLSEVKLTRIGLAAEPTRRVDRILNS